MTAPDTMKQSASNNKIYIRHIKEDGTVYYDNTIIKKNTIKFTQTHGFSQFDISTEPFDDPEFAGKSLLLGSELGVNFYMELPEEYEQGTMTFTTSKKIEPPTENNKSSNRTATLISVHIISFEFIAHYRKKINRYKRSVYETTTRCQK